MTKWTSVVQDPTEKNRHQCVQNKIIIFLIISTIYRLFNLRMISSKFKRHENKTNWYVRPNRESRINRKLGGRKTDQRAEPKARKYKKNGRPKVLFFTQYLVQYKFSPLQRVKLV